MHHVGEINCQTLKKTDKGVNSKNQQLLKKSTIVDFIHNCGLYCGLFFVDHIVDYFVDYFVDIFNNKRTVLRKTDG